MEEIKLSLTKDSNKLNRGCAGDGSDSSAWLKEYKSDESCRKLNLKTIQRMKPHPNRFRLIDEWFGRQN